MTLGLAGAAVLSVLGQVEVRGIEQPTGQVLAVSIDGVTVGSPPSPTGPALASVVVGWDRVRAVRGERSGEAALYLGLAEKARRARARLERGDAVSAEPALEDLFAVYAQRSGPTAAMVGEGLLWCRLSRGAQASALAPWLLWLRCGTTEQTLLPMFGADQDPGPASRAWVDVRVAFDQGTGLIPVLPPIWLDVPGTQALARSSSPLAPLADGSVPGPMEARAAALAALYVTAARTECGMEVPALGEMPRDGAAGLVWQVVASRMGDPAVRETARSGLRARIKGRCEPWMEAWARAAIGRSLLREDALESRRLGVAELMHLPARLADAVPYLTGVALAEGAAELLKEGDRDGADRLRGELLDGYSGHPALDYPPVRNWPAAPARGKKNEGGEKT